MSERKLTQSEIDAINKQETAKTKKDFAGFKAATKAGKCWICKADLASFEQDKPCLHWLLMPKGFRKKHFSKIYRKFDVDRIEAYLRWTATADTPFVGVNDIEEEHSGKNVIDVTIKHGELEWSISCSPSCFEGKHGRWPPHYHFQMRVKGQQFINYGEYHIPLSDYEIWMINIRLGNNPQIKHVNMYGGGLGGIMEELDPEMLLEHMKKAEDQSKAPFHLQTLIMAEPGKTISGDDVQKLIDESKRTGIPMAQLSKKLKGVKTTVLITPGDGIPPAAARKPKRKPKK